MVTIINSNDSFWASIGHAIGKGISDAVERQLEQKAYEAKVAVQTAAQQHLITEEHRLKAQAIAQQKLIELKCQQRMAEIKHQLLLQQIGHQEQFEFKKQLISSSSIGLPILLISLIAILAIRRNK